VSACVCQTNRGACGLARIDEKVRKTKDKQYFVGGWRYFKLGRIKLWNCTKSAIEMSCYAEEVGVDGLLIVTPYYNKTTQEGLIMHYKEIAKNVKLPIILYSVPSRTGVNILPETVLELSKIENIVAIKEASGNISQIAEIKALCKDNIDIYSGNDDQIVPIMSLGGKRSNFCISKCNAKFST